MPKTQLKSTQHTPIPPSNLRNPVTLRGSTKIVLDEPSQIASKRPKAGKILREEVVALLRVCLQLRDSYKNQPMKHSYQQVVAIYNKDFNCQRSRTGVQERIESECRDRLTKQQLGSGEKESDTQYITLIDEWLITWKEKKDEVKAASANSAEQARRAAERREHRNALVAGRRFNPKRPIE